MALQHVTSFSTSRQDFQVLDKLYLQQITRSRGAFCVAAAKTLAVLEQLACIGDSVGCMRMSGMAWGLGQLEVASCISWISSCI